MIQTPEVTGLYESRTGSVQYVMADPAAGACAIVGPALDFDDSVAQIN